MLIDVNSLLNDVIANPSAYNISNVTEPANPNAETDLMANPPVIGQPSNLSDKEQAEFLFYDGIHPTTTTHEQLAKYVAAHFALAENAEQVNLATDAVLALDDRFGFETADLAVGETRFNIQGYTHETGPGLDKRTTDGIRADLDFAVNDHMTLGGELFYATGESGSADYDSYGFGLDTLIHGKSGDLAWEVGGGLGFSTGDLTRSHGLGTLESESSQNVGLVTLHGAIRNDTLSLGGMNGYWELGLKQRLVYRSSRLETGAGSLDLNYDDEIINTTIANLEVGFQLTETFSMELALNPVLAHSGGEVSASQSSGLGAFQTSDLTGYDVHTARLGLNAAINESTNVGASILYGDDDTFGASIGASIDF